MRNIGQLSIHSDARKQRLRILFFGGIAAAISTYSIGAVFGVSYLVIAFCATALVITAAMFWPSHRWPVYAVGALALVTLFLVGLMVLLAIACSQGGCL
ncbi:MAG: hypothetical protein KGL26_05455 [Pseudomonadota bacterium]|nr:hypothetical protein [Pseudomonadota bacterium]